jgi:DNA primase large subunit
MESLQRGDALVCCFTLDARSQWRSLAPDGKVVLIDKGNAVPVLAEAPYVCTVKAAIHAKDAAGRPRQDGPVTGYVVRIDHPLRPAEYDTVGDADLEGTTLTLGLRHPTAFARLRSLRVAAALEEGRISGTPGHQHIELTLRHGNLARTFHVERTQAVRAGARFTRFLPAPPTPGPTCSPRPRHPRPRAAPGWQPNPHEESGHLLQDTASILAGNLDAGVQPKELEALARRRITEILVAQTYSALSPDTPDEAHLEAHLVILQRLALVEPEARRRLKVAERRAIERHARHQSGARLGILMSTGGIRFQHDAATNTFQVPLPAFLHLSRERSKGSWSLASLRVEAGTVWLPRSHTERLLGDLAGQAATRPAQAPPALAGLVDHLRAHAASVLAELAQQLAQDLPAPRGAYLLEAYPPCMRHLLRNLLERPPTGPEAFVAWSFLARIGAAPARIANAVHGTRQPPVGRYQLPDGGGRLDAASFRPPPCRLMKELGLCAWNCGVRDPVEAYDQAALRHRKRPATEGVT